MNPTFELGQIAGVRIGINWSWLIVFALIVWPLAAAVFPSQNPGLSDGEYFAMAQGLRTRLGARRRLACSNQLL